MLSKPVAVVLVAVVLLLAVTGLFVSVPHVQVKSPLFKEYRAEFVCTGYGVFTVIGEDKKTYTVRKDPGKILKSHCTLIKKL